MQKTDPDKDEEFAGKIGKRRKNAHGYEEYVLSGLSRQIADGADTAEVILKSTAGTGEDISKGSFSSRDRAAQGADIRKIELCKLKRAFDLYVGDDLWLR